MEAPAQIPVPIVINEGISVYRLLGIVAAFVIFASLLSFSENILNIDLKKYYYGIYYYFFPIKSATTNEDESRSGPAPVDTSSDNTQQEKAATTAAAADSAEQFWCFVGEDMVGRWCVQVLASNMCPSERTYAFKNECEKGKTT